MSNAKTRHLLAHKKAAAFFFTKLSHRSAYLSEKSAHCLLGVFSRAFCKYKS